VSIRTVRQVLAAAAGVVGAAVMMVWWAVPASAHTAAITISCTNVTFTYSSFPKESVTATETVAVDGVIQVSKAFAFTGPSGSDTVGISVPGGTHTVTAKTSWTVDGGGHASLSQQVSGCQPPCPNGTKANFRWHYSANGSAGSWSATQTQTCPGTISMGPQAMEGNLKVAPGTTLKAGYDFTIPGNKSTLTITVSHAKVVFAVTCVSGATPSASTITVKMPARSYTVTNSAWYPSGDQSSPLVYQGKLTVPDLCAGGQLRLAKGGTFTATLS